MTKLKMIITPCIPLVMVLGFGLYNVKLENTHCTNVVINLEKKLD